MERESGSKCNESIEEESVTSHSYFGNDRSSSDQNE